VQSCYILAAGGAPIVGDAASFCVQQRWQVVLPLIPCQCEVQCSGLDGIILYEQQARQGVIINFTSLIFSGCVGCNVKVQKLTGNIIQNTKS